MGAYLSEPVTEKESEKGGNNRLQYGATSMQGWRVNQEDAHNCIADFEPHCSLFAVYDGHGGAEVAKYTADHFPAFIKASQLWKDGRLEECFTDAFVKFDELLRSDDVIEQLKIIAGKKDNDDDSDEDDVEDKKTLIEEARMPLEDILKKYGFAVRRGAPGDGAGDEKLGLGKKKFISPNIRHPSKKKKKTANGEDKQELEDNDEEQCRVKLHMEEEEVEEMAIVSDDDELKKTGPKRSRQEDKDLMDTVDSTPFVQPPKRFKDSDDSSNGGISPVQNGGGDELPTFRRHCFSESQSSSKTKAEAAEARERTASGGSNGEDCKLKSPEHLLASPRQRNSKSESEAQDIAKSEEQQAAAADRSEMADIASDVAAAGNSRTTETPETQTAASSDSENSPDEDYKEDVVKDEDADDQDDTTSDGTEDEESSDDGEEHEAQCVDEEDGEDAMFQVPSGDTPGQDSGTTACVAVVVGNRLIVANAGDSRCVLSRAGKAVELSQDHKPEDDVEKNRIEAAGGCISVDGRVNGGLNLSRALGDHFYKRNEAIPLKDQMISPLPDVRVETLTEADRFMVLACDGIWNSMTSQEVISFVAERLEKKMALEKICEEMCMACLSPSTAGDGTGCDNMTVIVAQFCAAKED